MGDSEALMAHLLALGYGFSAKATADRLLNDGWHVTGTSRTPRVEKGVRLVSIEECFEQTATHILVSIPPDEHGDMALRSCAAQLYALPHLQWIGYLSTVGVYGDHNGGWVTEDTPCRPINARSQWRVKAEMQWLSFAAARGVPCQVFRLAGIYGPGRSAIDRVRSGRAQRIIKPGQVFNRIHVADIAAIVCAGIRNPGAGPIFNVADDEAAPPQDVIAYAADLLGLPPLPDIPFETAEMSPMARSFYSDNKRVDNKRIKTQLGVSLSFPTYREGLAEIVCQP